ncbi:MAG: PH domain-containing protein [Mobilicoccus sp.]|nr:PH domain-containing protein [Mobilicoccus sp.]
MSERIPDDSPLTSTTEQPAPASDPAPQQGLAADTTKSDTPWRRLDRRMLLILPLQAIGSFLPFIIVLVFVGRTGQGPWWTNLVIVIAPIVYGIWSWATTSYRITEEALALRRGIFSRTTLTARLDRIRTVDVTATLLHRILGVATVKVGTGSETPFSLDGLAAADASALRAQLLHVARSGSDEDLDVRAEDDADEEELARFSPAWIGYAPFSLAGLVTILAAAAFAFQFLDGNLMEVIESDAVDAAVDYAVSLTLAALIMQGTIAALVLFTVTAVITYVLRYWGYRLDRHPRGTFAVHRGLLTTRQTTIEERRLRGVELTRPLLLRLVGGARSTALVTGLGGGAESGSSSDLLVPPAPLAYVRDVSGAVMRTPGLFEVDIRRHGPAARRRRHIRALMGAAFWGVPVGLATWWWSLAPTLYAIPALLVLTAPLIAEGRYRRLGHAVTARHLVSRWGIAPESLVVVNTSAVIGWRVSETFFQRRLGLATLTAAIAAGDDHVSIVDIRIEDAEAVIRSVTPGLLEPFMESAR